MIYIFGDCEIDTRLYEFRRGGTSLKLEPKVFDVLAYVIQHRDRVVAKQELLDHPVLWRWLIWRRHRCAPSRFASAIDHRTLNGVSGTGYACMLHFSIGKCHLVVSHQLYTRVTSANGL